MTSCTLSLADMDKRVVELNRTLKQTISVRTDTSVSFGKIFGFILRIPSEIRLFFAAWNAERVTERDINRCRELLILNNPSPEMYAKMLPELRAIAANMNGLLESAYAARFPVYALTRFENCSHLWTDLVEDIEVAADPECRNLFDELAAELAKRQ